MKLAVCSIALRYKPASEAFRVMAQTGYRYADVFASNKDAHAFREMDVIARARVRELAAANRIVIGAMSGGLGRGFTADIEAEREKELDLVKMEIDLAIEIGAPVARIAPGDGEDLDKVMARAVPCLRRAAAYAEQKHIRLGMENHSGSITVNPDNTAALCREVGSSSLGVVFDPGNLLGRNVDYKRGLEVMREHIVHVHLKDGYPHYFGNDGFAPQRLACTLFGQGTLDIPWIMEQLASAGYCGCVSVEYEGCWHPEYCLPETAEGLAKVRHYMAQWFPMPCTEA